MPSRPRNPDSLMCRVEQAVHQLGPCTVDALVDLLQPHTREQIHSALVMCKRYKRLAIAEYGKWLGKGRGRAPSVYAPPGKTPQRQRVASVFDLWRAV